MSYNGYGQYSPYWQQTTGQTTPQNPSQNVGKSSNSYQPLSAYQKNQQPSQSFISQSADNSGAGYGSQDFGNVNVNGPGNGRSQDSRLGYPNSNDRASIDGATALGNLAYASSLGRESNKNRQQFNYSTVSSYGVGSVPPIQYRTGDERRDSNGSSREDITRSQQATASPSFGYSANNVGYPGSSAGSNPQAQPQYSQPSRYSTEQPRSQYSQPPRPPSSQSIQQSHSRLGYQDAPSPTPSANQHVSNQAQVSQNTGGIGGKEQTRVHTPQSEKRTPQAPKETTRKPQGPQATANSPTESASKRDAAVFASARETMAKRVNEVRQPPAVDSRRGQASKPGTPVESQYTTVDPSQVFNHDEYSKRQAAAAAKKAAEESEAARLAATQSKPATPQSNGTEPDSAKKDQIELEMKQMIEKMRDYKAKDPSLFSQVWEQVKKSQPPQRAPLQSPQGSAISPIVVIGQSPSPSLKQNSLPPESDLPAGNDFPPGSDRGRFPAQRRRRGGSTKVSTSRKSGTPKGFVEPAAEIQIAGNHESPVPPEIGIPTPKVGQIFPDPGSQSMQQAMKQFHQNSESPTAKAQPIPGSNVQVTTKTSTRPPNATMPTAPSTQFAPSQSAPSQSAPSQPAPAQPTPAQPAPAQPAPAQPALAQPAPPPKSGGTYWPESKKKALAEAAQIALTATPPNQAIRITTQEIHELLDQNPSYTQMCEILEYRGFIIDRGQFARILLKAVPDLGSASSPNNATSTNTASATRATPSNATPTVTASKDDTNTKLTSATPTAGSSGMVVKATSNGSAAQKKIHQPLWYSVPPGAEFQAPHGYVTPYDPNPPSMGQARNGYQSSGLPRDYRFVNHAARTPPEQRHNANITNQPCPNESALHFHPSFSLPQQPESTYGHVLDQNGPTYPNGTISHHPTKQEMARKRTFGEIVDLTQILSDDEELERHRPKARTDNGNAFVPSKSIKNIFDQVAQRQQNSGRTTPKPFKYKYSGRDALLQSYDIIEPMNKRRDALRRSTYNPKTIARDVLLGIGKHPTMAPLNAHLDVLKDRFKAVDYESDLSKFRWDLVDPEGEAKAQPSDTDEDPVPAVSAAPPQRPAPIAVMIDGDGGNTVKDDRTPTLKENSMATPYKRGPYKTKGIRSEIKQIGSADKTQRQSSQGSPSAQNTSNVPSINTPDLSRFAYNSPSTPQTDSTTLNAIISSTPGNSSNRKGRPPGAKNKQARPDKGISKKPKASYAGETSSAAKANPSGEETVKKKTPSIGKTSPFGIFLNGKPSAPVPSRPRFTPTTPSRPNDPRSPSSVMTSKDGIAVVIPSRSPSVVMFTPQTSAEKIRPKKTKDLSKSTQSSTTSYIMYRCHWEKCPAELHSLETLKKHVRKHRRAVDGVFPCLWADCSDSSNPVSNNTQNEDGQYRRLKFKTEAEWIQHVEINHFSTLMRSSGGGYC